MVLPSSGLRKASTLLIGQDFPADNLSRIRLGFSCLYWPIILAIFLRRLVIPRKIKHWSLRILLTNLIKIGAKVVSHSRYITFQIAEVTLRGDMFRDSATDRSIMLLFNRLVR